MTFFGSRTWRNGLQKEIHVKCEGHRWGKCLFWRDRLEIHPNKIVKNLLTEKSDIWRLKRIKPLNLETSDRLSYSNKWGMSHRAIANTTHPDPTCNGCYMIYLSLSVNRQKKFVFLYFFTFLYKFIQ